MSAPSASLNGSTLQQVAAGAAEAAAETGESVKVEPMTNGGRRKRGGGAVLTPLPLNGGRRKSRKGGRKSRRGGQDPEMAPVAGRRRKSRKGGKSRRH